MLRLVTTISTHFSCIAFFIFIFIFIFFVLLYFWLQILNTKSVREVSGLAELYFQLTPEGAGFGALIAFCSSPLEIIPGMFLYSIKFSSFYNKICRSYYLFPHKSGNINGVYRGCWTSYHYWIWICWRLQFHLFINLFMALIQSLQDLHLALIPIPPDFQRTPSYWSTSKIQPKQQHTSNLERLPFLSSFSHLLALTSQIGWAIISL